MTKVRHYVAVLSDICGIIESRSDFAGGGSATICECTYRAIDARGAISLLVVGGHFKVPLTVKIRVDEADLTMMAQQREVELLANGMLVTLNDELDWYLLSLPPSENAVIIELRELVW